MQMRRAHSLARFASRKLRAMAHQIDQSVRYDRTRERLCQPERLTPDAQLSRRLAQVALTIMSGVMSRVGLWPSAGSPGTRPHLVLWDSGGAKDLAIDVECARRRGRAVSQWGGAGPRDKQNTAHLLKLVGQLQLGVF